jgi:hypothetical protein
MSAAPPESIVMLTALLLATAPLEKAKAMRNARAGIPSWVLFAVLTALGIASLIFGLFNPELIAATFYEG